MKRKKRKTGTTKDGYSFQIIQEQNYTLTILVRYWVYIFSRKNKDVIVFGIVFNKEQLAINFVKDFEYEKEIAKQL